MTGSAAAAPNLAACANTRGCRSHGPKRLEQQIDQRQPGPRRRPTVRSHTTASRPRQPGRGTAGITVYEYGGAIIERMSGHDTGMHELDRTELDPDATRPHETRPHETRPHETRPH